MNATAKILDWPRPPQSVNVARALITTSKGTVMQIPGSKKGFVVTHYVRELRQDLPAQVTFIIREIDSSNYFLVCRQGPRYIKSREVREMVDRGIPPAIELLEPYPEIKPGHTLYLVPGGANGYLVIASERSHADNVKWSAAAPKAPTLTAGI